MHFIYSKVTADQIREVFTEGFGPPASGAMKDRVDQIMSYMTDVVAGDEIVFDYVPGTGTTVTVKGQNKGTIAGADFMKALWGIYLGPNPPTAKLKAGLLGQ